MKRQDKYPDTSTFHYHNANPKNRITTDCVIRALSTALQIPYEQVVRELAEQQCKTGYDDGDSKAIDLYLKSKGWIKQPQPRKNDGKKFTGKEWCKHICYYSDKYPNQIIANLGGHHTVAIMWGRIWDTWDSTDGCIGNYWIKG